MTFGSLFSGIGGIDLGLERAGMTCRWQVEIDPFCRRVLAKHWPDVRRHDDVRTFPPTDPADWGVDLIAGGFPCQDISYANQDGEGLDGERSGLWWQFARIIREIRPRHVLVENVSALLTRGLDAVLGTLAADGYDAEWSCIPAAAVGARHLRRRMFIVATARILDHADRIAPRCFDRQGREGRRLSESGVRHRIRRGPWSGEPGVPRVVNGLPDRMDRCRVLGNAVVPQISEWIGRRLMEA